MAHARGLIVRLIGINKYNIETYTSPQNRASNSFNLQLYLLNLIGEHKHLYFQLNDLH